MPIPRDRKRDRPFTLPGRPGFSTDVAAGDAMEQVDAKVTLTETLAKPAASTSGFQPFGSVVNRMRLDGCAGHVFTGFGALQRTNFSKAAETVHQFYRCTQCKGDVTYPEKRLYDAGAQHARDAIRKAGEDEIESVKAAEREREADRKAADAEIARLKTAERGQ
jgi:hypothetical protein